MVQNLDASEKWFRVDAGRAREHLGDHFDTLHPGFVEIARVDPDGCRFWCIQNSLDLLKQDIEQIMESLNTRLFLLELLLELVYLSIGIVSTSQHGIL